MKIIKVLGVVAGIHVFALMLIFANPGCSSTSKPAPAPTDTIAKSEPAPAISVPGLQAAPPAPAMSTAPISFNPDAPAMAGDGIRFTPTRPGTSAASTLVAQPVANVTPVKTYEAKSGDSLWTIAHKNDITVAELAAANSLNVSAVLRAGQKMIIPAKHVAPASGAPASSATTTKTEATAKQSAEVITHTVKSGETLGGIARSYGVKLSDLEVANSITDPKLVRAGAVLTIPGWKATSGKNAKQPSKASSSGSSTKPATPPEPAPVFGVPSTTQVPVIGPSSSTPDIPVIKLDDPSAPKKP